MKTDGVVRRAKKNDISRILFLGRNIKEFISSRQSKFYSKDELEDWIHKPKDNIILTVFIGNKLIGFLCAKIISKHWCMIDTIGVEQRYRGQKIGSKLLEKLYSILEKKNIYYAQAFGGLKHKGTRKFWKDRGFQEGKKFVWIEKNL
jgi:GNAT superfamily N-acetyltransferase